jgi:hypothetical protein
VVRVADLDGSRLGIFRVHMMPMNQPTAFTYRGAKEQANGALLAREPAPVAMVVGG